VNYCLITF